MSPMGGGKPLFDLISSGRRGEGAPPPRESSRREERRGEMSARTVTLPMIWVYAGAGLILLLLVAGYGIGYTLGTGSGREAELRAASRDAERIFVDDPLQENAGGGDQPVQGGANQESENQAETPGPGSGRVLLPNGRTGPDPRREGLNYLELVSLPRDAAMEAVRYLSENGQEAIGVPLDRRGRGSNTSDSFRVIALGLAVPGEKFRSSADARKRFEERLARLGKTWAEQGGASDFSDPLWRKYGG